MQIREVPSQRAVNSICGQGGPPKWHPSQIDHRPLRHAGDPQTSVYPDSRQQRIDPWLLTILKKEPTNPPEIPNVEVYQIETTDPANQSPSSQVPMIESLLLTQSFFSIIALSRVAES